MYTLCESVIIFSTEYNTILNRTCYYVHCTIQYYFIPSIIIFNTEYNTIVYPLLSYSIQNTILFYTVILSYTLQNTILFYIICYHIQYRMNIIFTYILFSHSVQNGNNTILVSVLFNYIADLQEWDKIRNVLGETCIQICYPFDDRPNRQNRS